MQLGQCSIAAVDLESSAEGWVLPHLLSYIITLVVSICGTFFKNMFVVLFLRPGIDM